MMNMMRTDAFAIEVELDDMQDAKRRNGPGATGRYTRRTEQHRAEMEAEMC